MTRSLQVREACQVRRQKNPDRAALLGATVSERSQSAPRLRVHLLVTTNWTARHRRRIPRSQRTSRRDEKFRPVDYEPAIIAAEQVIDL
jgi:hypothetical protein